MKKPREKFPLGHPMRANGTANSQCLATQIVVDSGTTVAGGMPAVNIPQL